MGYSSRRNYLSPPSPKSSPATWQRNNVPANQNNLEAGVIGFAALPYYIATSPLMITGISFYLSAGGTTGSITLTPSVEAADPGTAYDLTAACATTIAASRTFAPIAVSAGQRVGIMISTTADWDGTAGDLVAFLEVG